MSVCVVHAVNNLNLKRQRNLMITLDERTFAELVIGSKPYVIVDEDVRDAVANSDYGEQHMVCENSPDVVGWNGARIGRVQDVGERTDGKRLYRLWHRNEYVAVGNAALERRAERERKCAEADAHTALAHKQEQDAIADLRRTLEQQGIQPALLDKFFADMSPADIRKMFGLDKG